MQKIVLLPVYNPSNTFINDVLELKALGFICVVVNDGSSYYKMEIFEKLQADAIVIHCALHRGIGHALKAGLLEIMQRGYQDAIIMSVDIQKSYTKQDILYGFEEYIKTPEGIMFGCRDFQTNKFLRDKIKNKILQKICHIHCGKALSEVDAGMMVFHSCYISLLIAIVGDQFEYYVNLYQECIRKHVVMKEISILSFRKQKQSYIHVLKEIGFVYRIAYHYIKTSCSMIISSLFIL